MCDPKLESQILEVVNDFVSRGVLFTALDVSNKVKETMPFARHREVRDVVRNAWLNDIEPKSYGRTPITVNLADGTTADALLYHPLADSWDLDAKYDAQQRTKTSARPATSAPTTVTVGTNTVSVSSTGVSAPSMNLTGAPAATTNTATPQATNARDLWNNLFQTQPSLFPRK
jgi:hypothetical protein